MRLRWASCPPCTILSWSFLVGRWIFNTFFAPSCNYFALDWLIWLTRLTHSALSARASGRLPSRVVPFPLYLPVFWSIQSILLFEIDRWRHFCLEIDRWCTIDGASSDSHKNSCAGNMQWTEEIIHHGPHEMMLGRFSKLNRFNQCCPLRKNWCNFTLIEFPHPQGMFHAIVEILHFRASDLFK